MSSNRLKRFGVRQLNLGGGGGSGNMEYVFAGALALVIIGSLVLTFMNLFGGPGTNVDVEPLRFKCLQCDHEFTVAPEDLPQPDDPEMASMMYGPMGMRIPCPKEECGGMAVQMQKCLKCGEWFVSDVARNPERWMNSPHPPQIVCPYCKTDQIRYQEQLLEERAREKE